MPLLTSLPRRPFEAPLGNDGYGCAAIGLGEMSRVLVPGGRVILLDWCRDFWSCRLMDAVLRWMDPAYRRCFSLDELHRFINSAALSRRHSMRFRFGWIWGMMIVEAQRPQGAPL